MNQQKNWLKHYPKEVLSSYEYPKQNIAQFLIDSAKAYPQHTALNFLGKEMSYEALYRSSCRFANALQDLGIKKGDRVAIMLPNCPQTMIAYFGTLMLGAVVVQTNPLYMERELLHQMSDSGATAIVTLDALHSRVLKVQPETKLKHVIVTSIQDYLPLPKNWLYTMKQKKEGHHPRISYGEGVYNFEFLLHQSSEAPLAVAVNAMEDLALLQYTGGTTGLAKGVMLTHYNLVANTLQTSNWSYKSEVGKEIFLAALPFFHVFGLTVLMNKAVHLAGTLILIPRFNTNLMLKLIKKHRPTIFPGAPTMYIALINHPKIHQYDLSSIKICISGSAPLPVEVQENFEKITKGRLIEGYGLTEAAPVTHANNVWDKRKIGSIGIPFPDTEAKVVDVNSGEEVPLGEVGELVVKGPQVMKGYWNRAEETEKVLKEGWLFTGDLSKMDEDGFFYIVDRKKDMIIAGGFNIYPREIEEVLFEHPMVKEAVAVGVSDKYRGETVKAYIVLKEGAKVTEQELDQWCRERLAAYKVPKQYAFKEDLPKTMVGKVLRRQLREEEQAKM